MWSLCRATGVEMLARLGTVLSCSDECWWVRSMMSRVLGEFGFHHQESEIENAVGPYSAIIGVRHGHSASCLTRLHSAC